MRSVEDIQKDIAANTVQFQGINTWYGPFRAHVAQAAALGLTQELQALRAELEEAEKKGGE